MSETLALTDEYRERRWTEIQKLARAVADKDEAPSAAEQALCGAVVRAQEAIAALAAAQARVERLKGDCARLRKQIPGCDCNDSSQCWEPCGTLGHHQEFAERVTDDRLEKAVDASLAEGDRHEK